MMGLSWGQPTLEFQHDLVPAVPVNVCVSHGVCASVREQADATGSQHYSSRWAAR
jgi:hypothetical protein